MKAITLTQPWAQFVALGEKHFETRSWSTTYRGPLAIHAAKNWPTADKEWTWSHYYPHQICTKHGLVYSTDFARGAVIAIVGLVNVVPTINADLMSEVERWPERGGPGRVIVSRQEEALGNYAHGRFVWVLSNLMPMHAFPIPAQGKLGLWNWQPNEMDMEGARESWNKIKSRLAELSS